MQSVSGSSKADNYDAWKKNRKDSLERLLEEEDDMEFTVSFPSPHPTIQPVFEEVEPVVFVFGWEGAGDEELTRYSNE